MTSKQKWQGMLVVWGVALVFYALSFIPGLGVLTYLAGLIALVSLWRFISEPSIDLPPDDCCNK